MRRGDKVAIALGLTLVAGAVTLAVWATSPRAADRAAALRREELARNTAPLRAKAVEGQKQAAIQAAERQTKAAALESQLAGKRFTACRAKLRQAKELDLLYDLSWEAGGAPKVIAGPTFFTIPIDAKEGFTATLNCFLTAGMPNRCTDFDVRDWRTGKAVARFAACRLEML